jgi:hypothetical protein
MKAKHLLILTFICCLMVGYAHANDCVRVIELSKIVKVTTEDKSIFEEHAENFCKEYSKSSGIQKSASYGLSYKFLSASMGSTHQSAVAIASKFCSATDSSKYRSDAYKQYVETISPGAYSAYEKCIEMSKNNLNFDLDVASVLPDEFSVAVSFTSPSGDDDAKLRFSTSKGVTCNWLQTESQEAKLPSGSSTLLNCSRENQTKKSYVKIVRTDAGKEAIMTIPWQSYNPDGMPHDALTEIEKKYGLLLNQTGLLNASLKGSVMAFECETCPPGWKEYIPAWGRFIRGIDNSADGNVDPDGKRVPGSSQEDKLAMHDHSINHQLVTHGGKKPNLEGGGKYRVHWKNGNDVETEKNKDGIEETRPKNIALLYCIKED